jgi:uncharacterized surface protein with fasciclin (FAS1) repeats
MRPQKNFSLKSTVSIATVLIGSVALLGLPAKAQTNSNGGQSPNTSPNTITQPSNTAPNTTPGNTTPGTITPGNTIPSNTTPGNAAPTNLPSAPTTNTPATPGIAPAPNSPAANTNTPATTPTAATNDRYLSELLGQAAGTGSFSILARAVEAAGVTNALRDTGEKYTIFAPTDEAFQALPPDTLERLLRPENRELLREVLAYHVVPGAVTSKDLRSGLVNTLGGGVAVSVAPDRIVVNDASIIQPDIQAANGVIHVVNRVLMPQQLRQRLASLQ